MAEPKPAYDVAEDDAEQAADARAEADFAAGRTVSHAQVTRWLQSWGRPDELSCPEPNTP